MSGIFTGGTGLDMGGIYVSESYQDVGSGAMAVDSGVEAGFMDSRHDAYRQHSAVNKVDIEKRMSSFIRTFNRSGHFVYRKALKNNIASNMRFLHVELTDLASFDKEFYELLTLHPEDVVPAMEEASRLIVSEVMRSSDDDKTLEPQEDFEMDEDQQQIEQYDVHKAVQVTLNWTQGTIQSIRNIKSENMASLVKITGIVISATNVRSKAIRITAQCRSCRSTLSNIYIKPGLDGCQLPRRCAMSQTGCALDPYFILPNKCDYLDYQMLKLQDLPENVPSGEMPRHLLLYCDRTLANRVSPGNRISAVGIYSIRKAAISQPTKSAKVKANVGIRPPYLRVLGLKVHTYGEVDDDDGNAGGGAFNNTIGAVVDFNPKDVEAFQKIAASSDVYGILTRSFAPSIYGMDDAKKAIVCLLFGGARKCLPDGLYRRGDINLLLIGDPGTAKSQMLKFVERVAPIAVYTSGKGSSAAGLTAAIVRDSQTSNFIVEGGAMVLADGGVVCIDEFDKMREDDRVAIHEAMEQQTISIAKAGITSTLNTRCSVLAAANSVYGRWDDLKGESNIDFMPTILSRFDMIFIMKDDHDDERDMEMARHVIKVHMTGPVSNKTTENNKDPVDGTKEINQLQENETITQLSINMFRKYIAYCRSHVSPRLDAEACERLSELISYKFLFWRL
ncbi:hypothetical protein ACOME3_008591 [Neoechinorhynchus agilis]